MGHFSGISARFSRASIMVSSSELRLQVLDVSDESRERGGGGWKLL